MIFFKICGRGRYVVGIHNKILWSYVDILYKCFNTRFLSQRTFFYAESAIFWLSYVASLQKSTECALVHFCIFQSIFDPTKKTATHIFRTHERVWFNGSSMMYRSTIDSSPGRHRVDSSWVDSSLDQIIASSIHRRVMLSPLGTTGKLAYLKSSWLKCIIFGLNMKTGFI
jgi:hypothetical protein